MKSLISMLLLFCVFVPTAKTQNFVPNPSFENYSSCPTGIGQINLAIPWYDPTNASSDYFNQCASNSAGIPNNGFGSQSAANGLAYAGLYTFDHATSNEREYIQVKLSDTLISGKKYFVSFYVSLADNLTYATNNVGAYFSSTPVNTMGPGLVLNFPAQIVNQISNPLTNKNGWTLISDTLFAVGGELYMTIGNFNTDLNTDTVYVGGSGYGGAYYYIDDVSVTDIGWVGVNELNNEIKITSYPNPANDKINFEFESNQFEGKEMTINLYDLCGIKQKSQKLLCAKKTELDLNDLPSGIYFYELIVEGNKINNGKIIMIK